MSCPSDAINLYDDAVIRDPWPHYDRLRAKGPVVWLSALGNYAFTDYDTVRAGLRDHGTFISGQGAAADDFGCAFQRGNSVASDPPRHTAIRGAIQPPLALGNVAKLRPQIQSVADEIVARAVAKGRCDAVTDLAQPLPLAIVRDLVGLPDLGRKNMLKWASAAFDMQGIQNSRGKAAKGTIEEMRQFILRDATPDTLKPGSWTHRISEMAKTGALDPDLAPFVIRDYINPSLDTTISAIGHLVRHLGQDPAAWEALKADPALATNAAHEAIRIGTPIRSFSRQLARDTDVAGHTLPRGARVMMLYASANRDAAVFEDPARFDLRRKNARRHLSFGAGIHMCVGMHLALMEIECLIQAMTNQVTGMEVGSPEVALNNSICAYATLPVRLVA